MADAYHDRARPCRSCGASISMIKGPAGNYIPVQKVSLVYQIPPGLPGIDQADPILEVAREGEFYISHFQTCPQASSHSKSSSS